MTTEHEALFLVQASFEGAGCSAQGAGGAAGRAAWSRSDNGEIDGCDGS